MNVMGAACKICISSESARAVAEMVAEGLSDQVISNRLGCGIGRMSVQRHRKNHIELLAKAVVGMANKGADAAAQRSQVMAAAEAGHPLAFLALAAIVADMRRVQDRLERVAGAAEQAGQGTAVAALSGQQLRAAEVRAKMGGAGGYAAPRGAMGQAGVFSVIINLGENTETITVVPPVQVTEHSFVDGEN